MRHTPDTHISVLYTRAKHSPTTRGLPPIKYSKMELKKWLLSHGYMKLYRKWAKADFDRKLSPSLDRLNTNKGYSLKNIELVTWEENQRRAYSDRKKNIGRMALDNEAVVQLSKDGKKIKVFGSVSNASRDTKINRGNISSAKDGKLKSAGGFIWVGKERYESAGFSLESFQEYAGLDLSFYNW